MAGRPRTPVGAHGSITTRQLGPKRFEARTYFRAADGTRHRLRKVGTSETNAANRLKSHLTTLVTNATAGHLSSSTLIRVLADAWHADVVRAVQAGTRAPTTAQQYRQVLDNHVLPAVGDLTAAELTTPVADRFLKAKADSELKPGTVAIIRNVLSSVCGYAVRQGVIPANPVKDVSRIEHGPRAKPRALNGDQRAELFGMLNNDAAATARDIPPMLKMLLATGVRLGELLALTGDNIAFDDDGACIVTFDHHLVRVHAQGTVRQPGRKGGQPGLTLRVPTWAVALFRERKVAAGPYPVFPSPDDDWRNPNATSSMISYTMDRLGFGWVTAHTFRKSVATMLDESGRPTTAIADQLGNTTEVVERHYRAPRTADRANADALDTITPW